MSPHPAVAERLARLAPDQRDAATAPSGPVLCVAPAGSGKTTTLVARVAWLIDGGTPTDAVTVLAFNRRAAEELASRLDQALEPLGIEKGSVRVRTFHALGLEVLREAGRPVDLADRAEVMATVVPGIDRTAIGRLDLAFSRLKLELRVDVDTVAADPEAGPVVRAWIAYERELARRGALDFDDLVARSLALLAAEPDVLARWRARCTELLVDEAQDLDRSQLGLALLLAAPASRIFLVGDDDQTIYGWRLADVRRVLGLASELPGLRRVDLTTNYRCPPPVVRRAVRLVEHNRERFAKRIDAVPNAVGRLILAPDAGDEPERVRRILASWPPDGSCAILARTNRELLPAVAVALELGVPFRAASADLLLEDVRLDGLLDLVAATPNSWPLLVRIGAVRRALAPGAALLRPPEPPPRGRGAPLPDPEPSDGIDGTTAEALAAALLGWAPGHADLDALVAAIRDRRARVATLRSDDARLTLATAHATKGAEWDHVAVLTDGFPARRAVATAGDPERVLEEERRLGYVAWTRARRSLTLVYDPEAASTFLREAFDDHELGLTVWAA